MRVEAERFAADGRIEASVSLTAPDGEPAAEATLTLDGEGDDLAGTAYLTVENPNLWWTHDLGQPELYSLKVDLRQGMVYSIRTGRRSA